MLSKLFKNKKAGFYIGLLSSLLCLFTAIFYKIYTPEFDLYNEKVFKYLLVAGLLQIVYFIFKENLLTALIPLARTALVAISFGIAVNEWGILMVYYFTDTYGVMGDIVSPEVLLTMLICMASAMLLAFFSAFFSQTKKLTSSEKEEVKEDWKAFKAKVKKHRKPIAITVVILVVISVVTAIAYPIITMVRVDSVVLDVDELTLYEGDSYSLKHTIDPADADNLNVSWSTSDEKVATVNEKGYVQAVGIGEAVITVTSEQGKHTDTCKVTVKELTVEELTVEFSQSFKEHYELGEALDTNGIKIQAKYTNGNIENVTSLVTYSATVVDAKEKEITVSYEYKGKKFETKFTVYGDVANVNDTAELLNALNDDNVGFIRCASAMTLTDLTINRDIIINGDIAVDNLTANGNVTIIGKLTNNAGGLSINGSGSLKVQLQGTSTGEIISGKGLDIQSLKLEASRIYVTGNISISNGADVTVIGSDIGGEAYNGLQSTEKLTISGETTKVSVLREAANYTNRAALQAKDIVVDGATLIVDKTEISTYHYGYAIWFAGGNYSFSAINGANVSFDITDINNPIVTSSGVFGVNKKLNVNSGATLEVKGACFFNNRVTNIPIDFTGAAAVIVNGVKFDVANGGEKLGNLTASDITVNMGTTTKFEVGDIFDPAGMTFNVVYGDDVAANRAITVVGADNVEVITKTPLVAGDNEIELKVFGKTFIINVNIYSSELPIQTANTVEEFKQHLANENVTTINLAQSLALGDIAITRDLTINGIVNATSIEIAEGCTLIIKEGRIAASGALTISGKGTLEVRDWNNNSSRANCASIYTAGALTIQGATVNCNQIYYEAGGMVVEGGAQVTVYGKSIITTDKQQGANGIHGNKGDLSVSGLGTKLSVIYDAESNNAKNPAAIQTANGNITVDGATLIIDSNYMDKDVGWGYAAWLTIVDTKLTATNGASVTFKISDTAVQLINRTLTAYAGESVSGQPTKVDLYGNKGSALTLNGDTYLIYHNGEKQGEDPVHVHILTFVPEVGATCTTEGTKEHYVCACGKYFSDAEGNNEIANPETIPTLEHKDDNNDHKCDTCPEVMGTHEAAAGTHICEYCGQKASDCVNNNNDHNCDVCSEPLSTCEENYDEGSITKPATCKENGVKTYTCSICGNTKTEEIPLASHTDEDGNYKCDVCEAALCTEHQAGTPVEENKNDSTCSAEGSYDIVVRCTICNEKLSSETKTIDKKPHTEETVVGKPATCTETGLKDGKKCSVCGATTLEQEEIPAAGHSFATTLVVEGAKTTYIAGESFDTTSLVVKLDCANCDYIETVSDYSLSKKDNLQVEDTGITISYVKDGVTYTASVTIVVNPIVEKTVSNADEFLAALSIPTVESIICTADIALDSPLIIDRDLTITGNIAVDNLTANSNVTIIGKLTNKSGAMSINGSGSLRAQLEGTRSGEIISTKGLDIQLVKLEASRIYVTGNITVSNGADVTVIGADIGGTAYNGLQSTENLTISGETTKVSVLRQTSKYTNKAALQAKDIVVDGATLIVDKTEGSTYHYGYVIWFAGGNYSFSAINGANVSFDIADIDNSTIYSSGVFSVNKKLNVNSGATLEVKGACLFNNRNSNISIDFTGASAVIVNGKEFDVAKGGEKLGNLTVSSITVNTDTTTKFNVGDVFDPAGMMFNVVYGDDAATNRAVMVIDAENVELITDTPLVAGNNVIELKVANVPFTLEVYVEAPEALKVTATTEEEFKNYLANANVAHITLAQSLALGDIAITRDLTINGIVNATSITIAEGCTLTIESGRIAASGALTISGKGTLNARDWSDISNRANCASIYTANALTIQGATVNCDHIYYAAGDMIVEDGAKVTVYGKNILTSDKKSANGIHGSGSLSVSGSGTELSVIYNADTYNDKNPAAIEATSVSVDGATLIVDGNDNAGWGYASWNAAFDVTNGAYALLRIDSTKGAMLTNKSVIATTGTSVTGKTTKVEMFGPVNKVPAISGEPTLISYNGEIMSSLIETATTLDEFNTHLANANVGTIKLGASFALGNIAITRDLTISGTVNATSINIAEGCTLTIESGRIAASGALTISGKGTLNVRGWSTTSTTDTQVAAIYAASGLTIQNTTVNCDLIYYSTSLTVIDGANVTVYGGSKITTTGFNCVKGKGNIYVKGLGTKLSIIYDATTYNNGNPAAIHAGTPGGTVYVDGATLIVDGNDKAGWGYASWNAAFEATNGAYVLLRIDSTSGQQLTNKSVKATTGTSVTGETTKVELYGKTKPTLAGELALIYYNGEKQG